MVMGQLGSVILISGYIEFEVWQMKPFNKLLYKLKIAYWLEARTIWTGLKNQTITSLF